MAVPALRYATGLHIPLPPLAFRLVGPVRLRLTSAACAGRPPPPKGQIVRRSVAAFGVALPRIPRAVTATREGGKRYLPPDPPLPEKETYGSLLPADAEPFSLRAYNDPRTRSSLVRLRRIRLHQDRSVQNTSVHTEPSATCSPPQADPPLEEQPRFALRLPGTVLRSGAGLPGLKGISPLGNPPLPEKRTCGSLLPVRQAHGTLLSPCMPRSMRRSSFAAPGPLRAKHVCSHRAFGYVFTAAPRTALCGRLAATPPSLLVPS